MDRGGKQALTDAERRDAFARLFAQHDRWLFAYLVSLLGSAAHAEEVFQEVCVVLWRECETFQLGTDFVKWVSVIAHNQVHRFRRQQKRVGPQLSDLAVDMLAEDAVERADLLGIATRCAGPLLGKTAELRSPAGAHVLRRCAHELQNGGGRFGPAREYGLQSPEPNPQGALRVHRANDFGGGSQLMSTDAESNLMRLVGAICDGTITTAEAGAIGFAPDERSSGTRLLQQLRFHARRVVFSACRAGC